MTFFKHIVPSSTRLPSRPQARAVVINDHGEMLFVKHIDDVPANPLEPEVLEYWVPPGGGYELDENAEECARRECEEETSVTGLEFVRTFYRLEKVLVYAGEPMMMVADYVLFRVSGRPNLRVPTTGENIYDVRWWALEDVYASKEIFKPSEVIEQVRSLIEARPHLFCTREAADDGARRQDGLLSDHDRDVLFENHGGPIARDDQQRLTR